MAGLLNLVPRYLPRFGMAPEWTKASIAYLLNFLAFGEGDTAPVSREVLRQAEPEPARRPRIHVG